MIILTNDKQTARDEVLIAAENALLELKAGEEDDADDLKEVFNENCKNLARFYRSQEGFENELDEIKALLYQHYNEDSVDWLFD